MQQHPSYFRHTMKLLNIPSLLLIAIAVVIAYYTQKMPRYMPWHETRDWIRLLQIYDEQAAQQYASCDSKIIGTTFGATQVHACGDLSKAPVLFLHGAGSNALIYGDWLIPPLRESHYCIAVDFPCDVGRSAPKDMNPKNCPATQQDLAQWVQEILSQLSISKPTSIVGYSFGSLIAFIVALHKPHLVDKLVLIAPAAIFAPVEFAWIWRALVYGMTLTDHTHNWFMQFMSADSNFHVNQMEPHHKNLTDAIRLVSGTVLSVQADVFEDEVLREVIDAHPTFLLLGVNETVINPTLAAERAKTAGAKTKLYKNSGHLMLMENSRDVIAQDVASFIMHSEQHFN